MIAIPGEITALSISLKKFNAAYTGQTVTVRLVNVKTGAELLGSTVVPETDEPGVYSVDWTAPFTKQRLLAIYSVVGKIFEEAVDVQELGARDPGESVTIVGTVVDDDSVLESKVLDDDSLTGFVTE